MNRTKQKGQIAIMVLVISAVALTLGLSMSRKTTVETRVDTDETNLRKAFDAAESGVEYYLGTGRTDYVGSDPKSEARVSIETLGGGSTIASNGAVLAGLPTYFWLVGHNVDWTINYGDYYRGADLYVCVEEKIPQPMVYATYFWGEFSGSNLVNVDLRRGWRTPADRGGACKVGYQEVDLANWLDLGGRPLLLAVTPVGGSARIYLVGDSAFPSQGSKISSEGTYEMVRRKISVERRFDIAGFMLEPLVAANGVLSE